MEDHEFLFKQRDMLMDRRREILGMRSELEGQEERNREQPKELEEEASRDRRIDRMESLDEATRDELWSINQALQRIGAGVYQSCVACGGEISRERLEAIPWTRRCRDCAAKSEPPEPAAGAAAYERRDIPGTPPEYAGMEDPELCATVTEMLENDEELVIDDLTVVCSEGRVTLEGLVPTPGHRSIAHVLLEDVMGLTDVVDNLRIARPGPGADPALPPDKDAADADTVMHGEPVREDFHQAMQDGTSVTPPDNLVPDKE